MTRLPFIILTTIIAFLAGVSCTGESTSEHGLTEVADSFSKQYFTWHLDRSLCYTDSFGTKWVQYVSSNITPADLDVIKSTQEQPTYEIGESEMIDDTTALVEVQLSNVLLLDTIGTTIHFYEEATRHLHLRNVEGRWKVCNVQP